MSWFKAALCVHVPEGVSNEFDSLNFSFIIVAEKMSQFDIERRVKFQVIALLFLMPS